MLSSTFYQRINAGDRKGACEAIRWWIKDGGKDCRYVQQLLRTD
jgi:lysozyme